MPGAQLYVFIIDCDVTHVVTLSTSRSPPIALQLRKLPHLSQEY